MTYIATDILTENGQPIELFEFISDFSTVRKTNARSDYTYSANVYSATPISRSKIKKNQDVFKDNIDITMPVTDSYASYFAVNSPNYITTVNIRRGHLTDGDAEFPIVWKGRIVSNKVAKGSITFSCESIWTSSQRSGLRAKFQRGCSHALYATGCNLDEADFSTAATVDAVDGAVITLTEAGLQVDGYYTLGFLKIGGIRWFITNHEGENITLSRTDHGLDVSDSVTIHPGCDHISSTCDTKFSNLVNFGGMPFIPVKNPMSGSSVK